MTKADLDSGVNLKSKDEVVWALFRRKLDEAEEILGARLRFSRP
jgi:hypothetical protein